MKQFCAPAIAFVASLFLGVQSVPAQIFTWLPTSGGLYNTATNWSPAGGPPNASGETALFDGTATQTVTLQTNLTTSGQTIRAGNITYQLDGTTQTMTAAGLIVGDTAGTTGRFTLLNGTMIGDMALGNGLDSIGFFTIGADAVFDPAGNSAAVAATQGSSGTLTIHDGGRYIANSNMLISTNPTANGSVNVTGLGSSLSLGIGALLVGSTGKGDLTISDAAAANGGSVLIGDSATGIGNVTVSGVGSKVSNSANITVGNLGIGTLRIEDGGTVSTTGSARIASTAGAAGAATVNGTGSIWNAASLTVGGTLGSNGGTGTLLVENGGAVNISGNMEIRNTAGTSVAIDGGTLTVGGSFTKNGTLNLVDGTLHVLGNFDNGTANAQLVIDGATPSDLPILHLSKLALLSEVTDIVVGNSNRGVLIVDGGRAISNGANSLFIGAGATGDGAVTVTGGAGAAVSSILTGTLSVGGGSLGGAGVGSLTIGPLAQVSATTFNLFPQGTLIVDGGTLIAPTMNFSPGAAVVFNKGTFHISGNVTASMLDAVLGATHELGPGRTIGGGAGTTTLQTPLILTGGSFGSLAGGAVVNASLLDVRSGTVSTNFELTNNAGKTLRISDTGTVIAETAINNQGAIVLQNNVIPITGGTLTNTGTIRGTGLIGNVVINNGSITVNGDDIEFLSSVTNTGTSSLISGQNGTLRFEGGLVNSAAIAFSNGAMNIYGDVSQSAGGRITITGGGVTTFYDDVTIAAGANNIQVSAVGNVVSSVVFLGSYNGGTTGGGAAFIEGDHRPGNSPAIVNFGGDVFYGGGSSLDIEIGGTAAGSQFDKVTVAGQLSAGGTLIISLINGFTPAAGQSFDILDFAALTDTFSTLNLPALSGGLSWNTSELYTTGTLSVVGGVPGDYNDNGVVDAADYVIWRNSLGQNVTLPNDTTLGTVTQADYDVWRAHFGQTIGSGSLATYTNNLSSDNVPEPSLILLAVTSVTLSGCLLRRRTTSKA